MISSNRINIIALDESNSIEVINWVNNPNIKHLTGTVFPVSSFEHEKWIKYKATDVDSKLFIIQLKENSKNIGIIGLNKIDYLNGNAELYISIGETDYFGNGYGSEAISSLTDFCFTRLRLHKVYLRVFQQNTRAIQVYKKIGFLEECRFVNHVFIQGEYQDVLYFTKFSKGKKNV